MSPRPLDSAELAALVAAYADIFAYCAGPSGNVAALTEGLVRISACSAALEVRIMPLWHALGATTLTVAEDADKQLADRLFGLDGEAGILGMLKRLRRRAEGLPAMTSAQQASFLADLIGFAAEFLPGSAGGAEHGSVDLWANQGPAEPVDPPAFRLPPALGLPVYLQALALVVLVQGWIGGISGAAERAELARHRAFLTGGGRSTDLSLAARFFSGDEGPPAAALWAAASALAAY